MIEHLGLARGSRGNEMLLEDKEDIQTDFSELALDPFPVFLDHLHLGLIALRLLLLFDGRDNTP
jgi:hypothetical protein